MTTKTINNSVIRSVIAMPSEAWNSMAGPARRAGRTVVISLLAVISFCMLATSAKAQVANPVAFPVYDPFTSAVSSGGSAYTTNKDLGGQTNALGSYWYLIDSTGTAANSLTNTGISINYQSAPGFSGNAAQLTNAAGPGARMFVWTNNTIASGGNGGFFQTGPSTNFYSFVMEVPNIGTLSSSGAFICGLGDQGTIATQTSQPTTEAARVYLKSVSGGYEIGVAKMGTVNYDTSTVFTAGQTVFLVVDYEIKSSDATSGTADVVRMWINPATNNFGTPNPPSETLNTVGSSDGNLTPYTSCFQFYDIANTPSITYVTDFRLGTNWTWVTGGPGVLLLPGSTNASTGTLNLSATGLNNGTANTYNWQLNGTNLSNGASVSGSGATVSGAQSSSLTVSGMDTSGAQLDSGSYTVVVSNTWGAVTSSICAVTAFSSPVITVEPSPTTLQIYEGESNTIFLTALGNNLSYYWYSNSVLVSGVDTSNYTIPGVSGNASIYCIVSNSGGTQMSSVVTLTAVPAPTAPYPAAVIGDHPISFWPLNEGPDNHSGDDGTTAYDYAGGENGFYTNAVLGEPGYGPGLAAEYGYSTATDTSTAAGFGFYPFGGTPNSYVAQIPNINFASSGSGGSSFSVEAWINATNNTPTSGACIVGKGYGGGGEQFVLDYFSPGWRFYVREAGGTVVQAVGASTIDGNWHHLAGVLDTVHGDLAIYVDGIELSNVSYSASTGIQNSTNNVTIGSRQSGANTAFNDNFYGSIQEVAIYNYALTSAQVSDHYNAAGIGPKVTLPVSITNVDEGTNFSITATAFGTPPLTYQWIDTITALPLSGQTNATLTLTNVTAAAYNGHTLEIQVSNTYGTANASFSLDVNSGPPGNVVISPSSITLYAGVSAAFSVTAQNTLPFYYQWSTNGVEVSGATNSAFTVSLPVGNNTIGCAVSNQDSAGSPTDATASFDVIAAPTDTYGQAILRDSPIAFWRLDEPANSTIANDYVGGHDAAYNNVINGQPGFDISFPSETSTVFGTNATANSYAGENNNTSTGIQLIDFAAQGSNAEFSVELWINEQAESQDFLCKGYPNNTQFALDGGGSSDSYRWVVHNAADTIYAYSGSVAGNDTWQHVVGVCDEANGKTYLYVNGVLQQTGTIPAGSGVLSLNDTTYPVIIGAQEGSGGSGYTGVTNASISQVAIYAYALSSNQVYAHYTAATGLPPLGPFSIISGSKTTGAATLEWQSVSGYTYQVQVTQSLEPGLDTNAWINLGSPIVATGITTSYTDTSTNASAVAAYYRVIGY